MSNNETLDGKVGPVSLANEDAVKQVVAQSIFNLWDIVNNLNAPAAIEARTLPCHDLRLGARKPGTFVYDEVKRASAALAEMGCDIITGGGPGLMQAANEGAASVHAPERNRSVGIRVELPFEQDVNPFVEQAFEHKTFFTRLHHFVLTSDAFVVAPGGIGTVLELMMIWQLLQVKHVQGCPLILVGTMWPGLVDWAKASLLTAQLPLANPEDLAIPKCVNTADQAIALIREHHRKWSASS